MSFQNHNDRLEAAAAAKKAMLEKFKNKPKVDPRLAEERAAAAKAREEKRAEAERRRRERVELEKLQRKIAAEDAAKADAEREAREAKEAERRRRAEAEAAELLEFEQKARMDLALAARKARLSGRK